MNYKWNWGIFWADNPEGSGTFLFTLVTGLGWTLATAMCAWAIALARASQASSKKRGQPLSKALFQQGIEKAIMVMA